MLVRVCEDWKGTHGGQYYYVVEGTLLRHISAYSASSYIEKVSEDSMRAALSRSVREALGRPQKGPKSTTHCYEAPIEILRGKPIIEFSFSRSGYSFVEVHAIEDFVGSEYEGYPRFKSGILYGSMKDAIQMLMGYSFEISDPSLLSFVEEYKSAYARMVREIRAYAESTGFSISFWGHAERVWEALKDPLVALYSCLSLPGDRSRLLCLREAARWIHQLWILVLIGEGLGAISVRDPYGNPSIRIQQGGDVPACVFQTPAGPFSAWFEFQLDRMAHLRGMFTGMREYVRPDVVIARGHHVGIERLKTIDLLVECKEDDFGSWGTEVDTQMIEYVRRFSPRSFVLASLKPVPEEARDYFERLGATVVDGLAPGARDRINEFKMIVRAALL